MPLQIILKILVNKFEVRLTPIHPGDEMLDQV